MLHHDYQPFIAFNTILLPAEKMKEKCEFVNMNVLQVCVVGDCIVIFCVCVCVLLLWATPAAALVPANAVVIEARFPQSGCWSRNKLSLVADLSYAK